MAQNPCYYCYSLPFCILLCSYLHQPPALTQLINNQTQTPVQNTTTTKTFADQELQWSKLPTEPDCVVW